MTEREWQRCAKPHPMLLYLRGRGSNRKLRLYACACCRRIWGLLGHNEEGAAAVAGAEHGADGLTGGPQPCPADAYSRLQECLASGKASCWYAGHGK